jgi:CHAT domain-containing protein/Flp pilus assembly protein TadD
LDAGPLGVRLTAGLLGIWLLASVPPAVAQADSAARAARLEAEARAHLQQRQAREAVAKAREAVALQEQAYGAEDPRLVPGLLQLGSALRLSGDWIAARSVLQRAVRLAERARPGHPRLATALSALGFVLDQTGEYELARAALERALGIEERAAGPTSFPAIKTSEYLAATLERLGEFAAARALFERSVEFHERQAPNSQALADRLTRLAGLQHVTGDRTGARRTADRAVQLARSGPPLARALMALADIRQADGDLAGARPLRQRAVSVVERAYGPRFPWTADAQADLADLLLAMGDDVAARPYYDEALAIGRGLGAPEPRWRAAVGLGAIHEREGRLREALPLYREAVAVVETAAAQFAEGGSRQKFLETRGRLSVYDVLARALLRLHEQDPAGGYDLEARAVLDAKRGRVAAEALAAARPVSPDPGVRAAVDEVRARQDQALALEAQLREEQALPAAEQDPRRTQELTAQLAQSKAEYLALARELLERHPRLRRQFVDQYTVDPRVLAKFADRLPAGMLAIEYFATPEALWIFVVAPGGRFTVKRRAVTQDALYGAVEEYRRLLATGERRALPWADDGSATYRDVVVRFQQLSLELGEHLLGPVAAELEVHREIVLVPNDMLLYLPIHALLRATPDGALRFLAETHAVSIMTQLEAVDVLGPRSPPPPRPLLAMGNPDGTLRAASSEVRSLQGLRPSVMVYEGSEATKARLLGLAAQLRPDLHLATHGVFDPLRPERSYLLFAGPDAASRQLDIGEIAGLQLGDGLAILSACDTALGERLPGAALISLAAAFSLAGAQSVVASLWRVNDEATRDFMVAFHETLRTSGPAAALRAAQRALMGRARTAHPFYWAPFVLIGAR